MKFTQDDWGQRDIINIIIILTKRGSKIEYKINTGSMRQGNHFSQTKKIRWNR